MEHNNANLPLHLECSGIANLRRNLLVHKIQKVFIGGLMLLVAGLFIVACILAVIVIHDIFASAHFALTSDGVGIGWNF